MVQKRFPDQNDDPFKANQERMATLMSRWNPFSQYKVEAVKPVNMPKTGYLCAGASVVDITPPPGLPFMGWSVIGEGPAKGVRVRLTGKAIYMEDAQGEKILILATDLCAGSLIVHHLTAARLAKQIGIGLDAIMMTGTHTHSGPGHYYASGFYNLFGTNKMGFDEKMVHFLVEKLTKAGVEAYHSRRKVKLAAGQKEIYGLTRNRSLEAHLANFEETNMSMDKYQAIDPTLTIIRIDALQEDGTHQPLAALHNFSIHGTAVSEKNDLYTADTFGVTERYMNAWIKKQFQLDYDVVYGTTNGNSGNVSPNYGIQGYEESERIGKAIAQNAFELYCSLEDSFTDNISLAHYYEEYQMMDNQVADENIRPAKRPMVGWPEILGAEDGRSFMYKLNFIKENQPRKTPKGEHTFKSASFGLLQNVIMPYQIFPDAFAFQAMKIGPVYLLALPLEVTIEMGRRIREAFLNQAKTVWEDSQLAILCSVSNQYAGYLTTKEEYGRQFYEGASNIYGPNTGEFTIHCFKEMVSKMKNHQKGHHPSKWNFTVSVSNHFFPEKQKITQGKRHISAEPQWDDNSAYIDWQDYIPGNIEFDRPLVKVQVQQSEQIWEDLYLDDLPISDQGIRVAIRYLGNSKKKGMGTWRAVWWTHGHQLNGTYRFVILPRGGYTELTSQSFRFTEKPKPRFLGKLLHS